jgi:hypothetical protein
VRLGLWGTRVVTAFGASRGASGAELRLASMRRKLRAVRTLRTLRVVLRSGNYWRLRLYEWRLKTYGRLWGVYEGLRSESGVGFQRRFGYRSCVFMN